MKRAVLILSALLLLSSLHAQNRRKIDSLLILLSHNSSDTAQIDVLNALSFEYQKINPDSALGFNTRALQLADNKGYARGKATAIHNSGNILYFKGDFKGALGKYHEALLLREAIGIKKDIARSVGNVGNVYFAQGNYDQAMNWYQRMLRLGDSAADAVTLADANGNIANVYMMYGDYNKSLYYNLRSLKIREELGDLNGMEHSYNNIGGIYFHQGDNTRALSYIYRSLKLQQDAGNKKGVADSYENIGSIYYHLDSIDEALKYFNLSLRLMVELGNKPGIANAYDNLGSIYKDHKQYSKAIEYHRKALDISTQIGDQKEMANVLDNLGGDYIAVNDFGTALGLIQRALEIGLRTRAKYYIKNSYDYLVQLYRKKKDAGRALGYYELSSQLGDSMLNEENSRSIAEMQTRFDTEKKEKEIELLHKDEAIRQLELAASAEKNRSLQTFLYLLTGGILLLSLFVLLVFRSNERKKKDNALLEASNLELNRQKEITEQKNSLITDSVDYAQTLIGLRLPAKNEFLDFFSDVHIVHRAADIIGGCMYLFKSQGDHCWIVLVDCRTTGVPGAFLALLAQQACAEVLEKEPRGETFEVFSALSKKLETVMPSKGVNVALLKYHQNGTSDYKAGHSMTITSTADHILLSNLPEERAPVSGETIPGYLASRENYFRTLSAEGKDVLLIALKK